MSGPVLERGESCGVRQADFRSACSQPGRSGAVWRRQVVKSGPVELPQVEGAFSSYSK